jgi:hypothetical protein
MRAERDAVKAAGVSWWAYQSFMRKHEKQIDEEKLVRIPRTLDTLPRRKDLGLSWSGWYAKRNRSDQTPCSDNFESGYYRIDGQALSSGPLVP